MASQMRSVLLIVSLAFLLTANFATALPADSSIFVKGGGTIGAVYTAGFAVGSEFLLGHIDQERTGEYFYLGPMVSAHFAFANLVDLDALFRIKFPVPDTNDRFSVSLGIPFGASLAVIPAISQGVGFGWNFSVLPAAHYFLTKNIEGFVELGFVYHGIFPGTNLVYFNIPQGAVNFGIAYVF